jgi:hypothetical protein
MLRYLPALDAYLWLTVALWQVVVAAIVLMRPSFRRAYPAFGSFACFAAIRSATLMLLPAKWYFLGYAIGSTATSLLIGATLFELYTRVCGPHFSLPSWVPRTMASWLALAVTASMAAALALYSVRLLEKRAAILAATQGGMLLALSLALLILLAYSKYLKMEWQMRPRQIAAGLCIYLFANALVLLLLSHVPVALMRPLDRSSQVANVVALIWWTFTLRRREPAPEPVTQEIIDTILAFHQETVEAAESVGLVQPVK